VIGEARIVLPERVASPVLPERVASQGEATVLTLPLKVSLALLCRVLPVSETEIASLLTSVVLHF